jgi:hypothetical protein
MIDNKDPWYAALNAYSANTGRVLVASTASGHVMVVVQPDGSSPGLTLDQLRDKLIAADFDDAVALDGSTSAMLYRNGTIQVPQSGFKNRVTAVGLGFFYDPPL